MLPPNPELVLAAQKMRKATVFLMLATISAIVFSILAVNSCNAICTDLYYFYECYSGGDIYCCSSTYCSGSCILKTSSCTGLTVAAIVSGVLMVIAIITVCVFGSKLRAIQREMALNGYVDYANPSLGYPNPINPPYYNNNPPIIYGNNQPPYQPNPYNQNPYPPQPNNYVAPRYYNQS